ncbi:MAG: hypothetical protein A2887_05520 [Alphaproteobacteria bacterium RIFCSPLOWO2_01_FULL_40_26]|nr:MAG: hypothetical protein A3D15_05975 [Alphaproteobacteria bacterium RIFCSPHIGHO2_02_FULL_40_34]OFW94191.1 MAG: hypothetical protein A2887_05520 [Alphaproteobacteria bacterium RIFCSPLOWO2_01_FULL_40_26]OFX09760.1 MAG: hypothetical protein A3H30_00280 [Alphaproteobacteria bacterium RIFCSPLOWO2_02_FULL_40_19]OFX12238.1 MAG: hypothetical protein A3G22_01840 [Alphaproteobacteria bacterium RIFCSPLOWO2_12_FULL_40_11]
MRGKASPVSASQELLSAEERLAARTALTAEEKRELDSELFEASRQNDVGRVISIINRGADVNAKNGAMEVPLILSVARRGADPEICRTLLRAGADPTYQEKDPANYAAGWGFTEAVKAFCDHPGFRVYNRNMLMTSAANGHMETARFLLDRFPDLTDADKDAHSNLHGKLVLPLHWTALVGSVQVEEAINLLLEKGADITARTTADFKIPGWWGLDFTIPAGSTALDATRIAIPHWHAKDPTDTARIERLNRVVELLEAKQLEAGVSHSSLGDERIRDLEEQLRTEKARGDLLAGNLEIMQRQMEFMMRRMQALESRTYSDNIAILREESRRLMDDPEDFCCPISGSIMSDPVLTAAGHSYDRASLLQHFEYRKTDPKTRQDLGEDPVLNENYTLKALIASHVESTRERALAVAQEFISYGDFKEAKKLAERASELNEVFPSAEYTRRIEAVKEELRLSSTLFPAAEHEHMPYSGASAASGGAEVGGGGGGGGEHPSPGVSSAFVSRLRSAVRGGVR